MSVARTIVAVGMSGGIDSAVAAWRLREEGWQVVGVTMRIWDGSIPLERGGRCGCLGPGEADDVAAAQGAAAQLGIRHVVVDLAGAYRERVLDVFRTESLAGRTPNPCAVCNPAVKFGALWTALVDAGVQAERFATGHYARLETRADGCVRLWRGVDRSKDQSYFLARLGQDQLRRTLFPLGGFTKEQVRGFARPLGLTAQLERPESQDFFEGPDRGVLFSPGDVRPGPILDKAGRKLGEHRGLVYYTVGQREGLGIATGARTYVCALDVAANALVVGSRDDAMASACEVHDMAWIEGRPSAEVFRAQAQLRYRHPGAACCITCMDGNRVRLVFDEPQFAVTPGQMAVLYDGDRVLGGGWIRVGSSESGVGNSELSR